jgi:glutamate 5-kinase
LTRLVVKLGSSSIASGDGLALNVIAGLINQVAVMQRAGHEILLVTSGAARLGERLLAFEGPTASAAPALRGLVDALRSSIAASGPAAEGGVADDAHERLVGSLTTTLGRYDGSDTPPGALGVALPASVGQPALMALYRQLAAAVGVEVCQILVSKSDLDSARAMSDLGSLLGAALERGLLPIVNGNDVTDPVAALDNDQIAVAVAVAAEAQRLLFLTDVGAVYRDSTLSERIAKLTPDQARSVRAVPLGSGRGGMRSKLSAAARAAYCGVECIIAAAREPDVVARSLNPRARMGTVVRAAGRQLDPQERWIGGVAYSVGSIGINREAESSLRTGSTLFLSGIKRLTGDFEPGSVVELVDVRHPERLIGRGCVALSSSILLLLRALSPDDVASVISMLFRMRHSLTATGRDAPDGGMTRSRMVCPDEFEDSRQLAGGRSRAARQALAQLRTFSLDTVIELTDSLMLAQPRLCAAILLDGSFRLGRLAPDSAARRAARDIHAIHRDSLVVYAGHEAGRQLPGRSVLNGFRPASAFRGRQLSG